MYQEIKHYLTFKMCLRLDNASTQVITVIECQCRLGTIAFATEQ